MIVLVHALRTRKPRVETPSCLKTRFRVNGAPKIPASRKRPLFDLPRLCDAIAQASFFCIPENDVRFIRARREGGYGLDAQWSDDFHHALHTLLTHEQSGYYPDSGKMEHLEKAFTEGFVYTGQYSSHRMRRHGNSSRSIPAGQFVVCAQNHDQVGNRLFGDRLATLVSFEALKLAAGIVILSPYLPLLFMGEEYGESAPFQCFTSHSDAGLIEAVRRGRSEEFAAFRWQGEPPDPQDDQSFLRSKLDHRLRDKEPHGTLMEFYRELIKLRRTLPGLARPSKERMEVHGAEPEKIIQLRRWSDGGEALIAANFSDGAQTVALRVSAGDWAKVLDSADARWMGPGSTVSENPRPHGELEVRLPAKSFSVFQQL